jgi:hypothetical protein
MAPAKDADRFALVCDQCGLPAVSAHFLPSGERPERVALACDRHDPEGEWFILTNANDLESLRQNASVLDKLRPGLSAAIPSAHANLHLDDEESLWVLAQAKRRKPSRGDVTLALTSERLVSVDEHSGAVDAVDRRSVRVRGWDTVAYATGNRLTLELPDVVVVYVSIEPTPQAARIAYGLGFRQWAESTRLLPDDSPRDPEHTPLACFSTLALYPDRLIDEAGQHLPLEPNTRATVDTAGDIAATRGRDLAAKAAGGLLTAPVLGPLGFLMFGNAKVSVIDTRELYLVVESEQWIYTKQVAPDSGGSLRDFAQKINLAARRLWPADPHIPPRATPIPSSACANWPY